MRVDDELLNRINAYLDHKLPQAERESFARQMAADSELAEEVKRQDVIREAVLRNEYASLIKGIRHELNAQEQAEEARRTETPVRPLNPVRSVRWSYWAAAASLVLLAGVAWFFLNQGPDTERLYVDNFTAQPKQPPVSSDPELMGAGQPPTGESDSTQVMRALGVFNTANLSAVEPVLKQVATQSNSHWSRVAQWYLAMLYLKQGDVERARQQVQTIAAEANHPYQVEAARLKKELE
ncbi:hypothetical protein [Rudanella lutea]|uniref:hypothetical protein n=1 Tax=Rudanella lutea TaxID=451374 RepID=UPI000381A155|nr:hypothetical protein [Rudanella lutea]